MAVDQEQNYSWLWENFCNHLIADFCVNCIWLDKLPKNIWIFMKILNNAEQEIMVPTRP